MNTKYKPTEGEAQMVDRVACRQNNGRAPRLVIEQTKPGVVRTSADHPNHEVWQAAMCDTFGTSDFLMANEMLSQVMNAVHHKGASAPVNQAELNAALAMIHGIAPRDATEAMLAVQMVAAHHAALECLRRSMEMGPRQIDFFQKFSNTATKLLRTFPSQMEALKRYRSKGEQRVVVQHHHVSVKAEQAAVQVNAPASIRGGGHQLHFRGSTPCTRPCRSYLCTKAQDVEPEPGRGRSVSPPQWRMGGVKCTAENPLAPQPAPLMETIGTAIGPKKPFPSGRRSQNAP